MSSQDLFSSDAETEFHTPIEFSGVSAVSEEQSGEEAVHNQRRLPKHFLCCVCNKTLKTEKGFAAHQILHKINDANTRKPSFDDLSGESLNCCIEVIKEMIEEPVVDNVERLKFLNNLLSESVMESQEFFAFLSDSIEPMMELLTERKKVLPSNNFDDVVYRWNIQLNDKDYINVLNSKLQISAGEGISLPDEVMQRLVYRFVNKLFYKMQIFVYRKMKCASIENKEPSDISEREMEGFLSDVGCILRSQYKKNQTVKNKSSRHFCSCLRQKFVVSVEEPLMEKDFLNTSSWKPDGDGNVMVKLSERSCKLFTAIENILRKEKKVLIDSIFEILFKPQHEHVLDLWNSLTAGHLTELEALKFLKDITLALVNISCKAEAFKQLSAWQRKNREQKHALRSGLKTN